MEIPYFEGLCVKVQNAKTTLYGTWLEFYNEHGFLIVADVPREDVVMLKTFVDGMYINYRKDILTPILPTRILDVLETKKREKKRLEREILEIEDYINTTLGGELRREKE